MRILALVTARAGSKRLPGKNTRVLGGKPLVRWTLDAVAGIPEISSIIVSTDDPDVARIAKESGAEVPWMRPAELSSDTATSVDVALHALEWFERERGVVDGLLLLQPTSPFRTRASIERGIEMFRRTGGDRPVVGVSPALSHPMRCFQLDDSGVLHPFVAQFMEKTGTHALPPAYTVNGAFYLVMPGYLLQHQSFFGSDALALVMDDPDEALDIDTERDWISAVAVVDGRSGRA